MSKHNILPLVSIIIPIYNAENCIKRCLDSILIQSYQNIEIILINDGSTDESGKICNDYLKNNCKIIVKHISNSGVSNARNKGLELSSGDYIVFIDVDDYIKPTYLEDLISHGLNEDITLVQTNFTIEKNNQFISNFCVESNQDTSNGDFILMKTRGFVWGKLFRKDIIEIFKIRFNPKISLAEDLCFVLEYLKYVKKVSYIFSSDYIYVQYDTSSSRKVHSPSSQYIQIQQEYSLLVDLAKKWPYASKGINYRFSLLGKSIFNLVISVFTNCNKMERNTFLNNFPIRYSSLIKNYHSDSFLKNLIINLVDKREWQILTIIFSFKHLFK